MTMLTASMKLDPHYGPGAVESAESFVNSERRVGPVRAR
jgi:hypothetical protein